MLRQGDLMSTLENGFIVRENPLAVLHSLEGEMGRVISQNESSDDNYFVVLVSMFDINVCK